MHSDELMKDFVIKYLNENLPAGYHYHNDEHTLYVVAKVIEIGGEEDCTDHEIKLLTAAALWHDTGYVVSYNDHEIESCRLAQQHLPHFGYTDDEIRAMCGMIMATQIPQTPTNKLEQIIADADLEYLGTGLAEIISERLYLELRHLNPHMTLDAWNRIQVNFLQKHRYFTDFCREHKEPGKQAYLSKLQEQLG
jgi:uncharacterized protein